MRIIYFSAIPYNGLRQRPQYIADGLAKEHDVVYVNPTVSLLKYLSVGGLKPWGEEYKTDSGVSVYQLNGTFLLPRFLEGVWSGFGCIERLMVKKLIKTADAVWIGYEPWLDLIGDKFSGKVVYDQMDDNVELTNNPLMKRLISRTRSKLLERSDILFVTAQRFYMTALEQGLNPVLIPNGVQLEETQEKICQTQKSKSDIRTFGYIGVVARWFDTNAIMKILEASPKNRVVIVGPEEIDRINDPRVCYVGEVPKRDVNEWIASFDVCLYPFRRSSLLDTINPVKIYEYLAQNKPVIAVRSIETDKFGEKLYTYDDLDELSYLASDELSAPFKNEQECMRFVEENSWEKRTEVILEKLHAFQK